MFNAIDISVLIVATYGTIMGFYRKLSGEIARFVGAAVILTTTLIFYRPAAEWISIRTRLSESPDIAAALSFVIIATGAFICMRLLRWILRSIMQLAFNKKIDTVGGAIAGFLKAVLLSIILIIAAGMWPNAYIRQKVTQDSLVGRTVFKYLVPPATLSPSPDA